MSYEIRWLRDDEHDEVLDLLAEVMDANRGYFSDSFARSGSAAPSLICVVDGEIASHLRIFERGRTVGNCLLRSAEIGDVCTHPRYRGHGFMTALLNTAAHYLYPKEFDISSVYSGVPIYQKAGWVAFPEPDQYLLWRLINIKTLFARTTPVFEARAAALDPVFEGVICVSCAGQSGFLEFREGWCRPLDHCASPDLALELDQLTFFRLLLGRDASSELGLPADLKLSEREAQVIEALFPKARPRF